jgi:hypothetical protein
MDGGLTMEFLCGGNSPELMSGSICDRFVDRHRQKIAY